MEAIKETFGLDDEQIRCPIGAETGADVKLTKQAMKEVRLSIECKDKKRLNIFEAIEQSKSNCPKGCDEAVVFKRGDTGAYKTYICVPLEHYLDIRRALLLYEEEKDDSN